MRLFDASVLVAAYSKEDGTPLALSMLCDEPEPAINALGLAETQVSLIRKRKRGVMTAAEVRSAMDAIHASIEDGSLRMLVQPERMWVEAVAIADRVAVHLRTQDAIHAAFAKLTGTGLATFDEDLAAAARAEGIHVLPKHLPGKVS